MAFRKQMPQEPIPTVREMVKKYGDDWYLFCASSPISQGVWRGDKQYGDYSDAIIMKMCEEGRRDRVSDWDILESEQ